LKRRKKCQFLALDTVNHDILLKRISLHGIKDNYLKLFKSNLSQRKQYIVFDKSKMDLKEVSCGVLQGSILGPLLFIIYINDLCKASKKLNSIMFADDINLFLSDNNISNLFKNINEELCSVHEWFKINKTFFKQ